MLKRAVHLRRLVRHAQLCFEIYIDQISGLHLQNCTYSQGSLSMPNPRVLSDKFSYNAAQKEDLERVFNMVSI